MDQSARDPISDDDATGIAWIAIAVLVVAVVLLLGVGVVFYDAPLAATLTDLGIGFAWLLAATYVGFRIPGAPRLRLLGAVAFLVAATTQFLSLFVASTGLRAIRLVGILAGTAALLALVLSDPAEDDGEMAVGEEEGADVAAGEEEGADVATGEVEDLDVSDGDPAGSAASDDGDDAESS